MHAREQVGAFAAVRESQESDPSGGIDGPQYERQPVRHTTDNGTQTCDRAPSGEAVALHSNADADTDRTCVFAELPRCHEPIAQSLASCANSELGLVSNDERSARAQRCRLVSHSWGWEPMMEGADESPELLELAQSVACSIEPLSAGFDSLRNLLSLGLGIDLHMMPTTGSRSNAEPAINLKDLLTATAERCSDCVLQLHVLQTLTQSALLRLADAHARLNLEAAATVHPDSARDEPSPAAATELACVDGPDDLVAQAHADGDAETSARGAERRLAARNDALRRGPTRCDAAQRGATLCAERRLAGACVVAEELLARLAEPAGEESRPEGAHGTQGTPPDTRARDVKSGANLRPSARVSLQRLNPNRIDEQHGPYGGLSSLAAAACETPLASGTASGGGSVALRGRLARLRDAPTGLGLRR
jgi:hypothetical protein